MLSAVLAFGAAAPVYAFAADSVAAEESSVYLKLPGFIDRILAKVLPHAEVAKEDLATGEDMVLSYTDPEVTEAIMNMRRPIIVNIHDFEEGIAIVEGIGDTSSLTVVGDFVISDEMQAKVQAEIDRMTENGREPSILLLDLETGAGLAFDIDDNHYSASSIKAINICALCSLIPESFTYSYEGMRSALVNSSNDAYEAVFNSYSDNTPNLWRARAHLGNQQWGRMYTNYTVRQFAQLWLTNWDYLTQEGETQETLRSWMSATLASSFAAAFGEVEGYTVVSKAGWEGSEVSACNEGGYIETPNGAYLLCIMTDKGGLPETYLTDLVKILDEAYQEYAPQKARG